MRSYFFILGLRLSSRSWPFGLFGRTHHSKCLPKMLPCSSPSSSVRTLGPGRRKWWTILVPRNFWDIHLASVQGQSLLTWRNLLGRSWRLRQIEMRLTCRSNPWLLWDCPLTWGLILGQHLRKLGLCWTLHSVPHISLGFSKTMSLLIASDWQRVKTLRSVFNDSGPSSSVFGQTDVLFLIIYKVCSF